MRFICYNCLSFESISGLAGAHWVGGFICMGHRPREEFDCVVDNILAAASNQFVDHASIKRPTRDV